MRDKFLQIIIIFISSVLVIQLFSLQVINKKKSNIDDKASIQKEPTPENNPLIDMDNVLITPHLAAFTQEAGEKSRAFAMYNSNRVANGEEPESVVLPDD